MNRIFSLVIIILILGVNLELVPCTVFVIKKDGRVLAGNNEDFVHPLTRMWFIPAEKGSYGRVYFGFDNLAPQGGMNEKGLFYDGLWVPDEAIKPEDKPVVPDDIYDRVMAECASVDEVVAMVRRYKLHVEIQGMLFYGDSRGDAVIIGGGDIVSKSGDYLLSTNFYPARTRREDTICWRYLKADQMLKSDQTVSPERIRSILEAVHVKDTQYSIVYDLINRTFQLCHYHNFQKALTLDLKSELLKGQKVYDIAGLFSDNPEFRRRYPNLWKHTPLKSGALFIFLLVCGLVFLSTPIVLMILQAKTDRNSELRPLKIILSLGAILALVNLLALWRYSALFIRGLPSSLAGLSPVQVVVLHIPWMLIILLLVLIWLMVHAFRKKQWAPIIRFFSLTVTVMLLAIVLLFWYWDLIRIYL